MSHDNLPDWAHGLDERLRNLYIQGALKGLSPDFIRSCEPIEDKVLKKDAQRTGQYRENDFEDSGRVRWLLGIKQLGQGAMGSVREGFDTVRGREVAIKIMHIDSPQGIARFQKEAVIMARLNHPALVQVHDFFVDNDRAMLTMDKLDSKEYSGLDKVRGQMKLSEFLTAAAGICDVVDYCGRNGVIHRDLKPENIMVNKEGKPKVIDFGISSAVMSKEDSMQVASYRYVSREKANGQVELVDTMEGETFILGTIMYEMITGEQLYKKGNGPLQISLDIIMNVALSADQERTLREAASKMGLNGEMMVQIINKSHAVELDDRYHSATELYRDVAKASQKA